MSRLGGSPPSIQVSVPPRTGSFFAAAVPLALVALLPLLPPVEPLSLLLPQAASSTPPAPPTRAPPSTRRLLRCRWSRVDWNMLALPECEPPTPAAVRPQSIAHVEQSQTMTGLVKALARSISDPGMCLYAQAQSERCRRLLPFGRQSALRKADAGIQLGIGDVGDQVDQHKDHRE